MDRISVDSQRKKNINIKIFIYSKMKWKKNAVSRQHNKRKARPLLFLSLFSFVCCYIYCVRNAKLFRRGWMSRWAARWLAAGIAIYAHQMKREMTSDIFSSILHRCWGIDGGFSAVCIYLLIHPNWTNRLLFFLFSVPLFIPSIAFSLSPYTILFCRLSIYV